MSEENTTNFLYESGNLYVNYLAVNSSDCVIIRLPNEKIFVIDTASCDKTNEDKIKQTLDNLGAKSIDVLLLSHPDADHYGNTLSLINSYSVKEVYAPKVNSELFSDFSFVLEKAKESGSAIKEITTYEQIVEDEVSFYFLYAKTSKLDFDLDSENTEIATNKDADDLSPIILLEYKGIRFLFCGDALAKNEQKVIENNKNNSYSLAYQKQIDLTNIDYYMLSSHGSSLGNSNSFLQLLCPKNAIISVGGGDYNAPNISKIEQLTEQNCRVLRTDNKGDIVVCVNKNGGTTLTTEYDLNNN